MENRWVWIGGFVVIIILSSLIVVGCRLRGESTTPNSAPTRVTATPTPAANSNGNQNANSRRNINLNLVDTPQQNQPTTTPIPAALNNTQADYSFNTLLTLLDQANLTQALDSREDFTLFAPTDQAFNRLGSETLDQLLAQPQQLEAILRYHVLAEPLTNSQLIEAGTVTTLNNRQLSITGSTRNLRVSGARVVDALPADNGVIYVVDSVIQL